MKKQYFFIMMAISLMVVGCKTLPPTITNATSTSSHRDSVAEKTIYVHDTTYIDRYHSVITSNDTIYRQDSIYIYVEKYRYLHDTVHITHTDTIQTIKTQARLVENPIAPFVRNSCIALWVIIGVAILALIIWIVWNFATGKFSWQSIVAIIPKLIFGLFRK